ncbi:unnamed protein product [Mytilus coruscus]|uniref:Uncharacterized protein n=1 Tax=Mytilus coruscus TaxID=42192 RepID=A0A6J8BPZ7_MYTCO|nr:unnamed protein product [Mytilus coruscus]
MTVESTDKVSYTSSYQRQSTVSMQESTSSKATMKPPTSTIQHVLHTSLMLEQSSVTLIENIDMKGLSTREVLVYSLGSAAFGIICTFMCVAFICFHRSKTRQLIENSTINSENQVNDDTKSCYSLYESIDEDAIYDDNILDDNSEYSADNYCKTESEGSTLNSEKSDYLLPFTSVIPNRGLDEHLYCTDVRSVTGSSVSSLSDHMKEDLKPINQYEQLQTELSKQSKSEYTNLQAVYYLELIDIRKSNSNDSFTEIVQNCCDSTVGILMNNLRKSRKYYSNNDISGEEILSTCITSKNKTEIRRCYSE